MSGLAAVLFRDRPVDGCVVPAMLAAAPHRGPRTESVALGRAVLGVSYGDLADASVASNGHLAAALAGVLDDREALRRDLVRAGLPVAEASDAGLLLAAFHVHGRRLPAELRGNYAVAVTDGKALWCFRDHLGFRSLFHRDEGPAVFVASEAKQVAAGAGLPLRADREVVERIFYGNYDDETPAAIRGVDRLPKATLLEAAPRSTSLSRYWDPADYLESERPSPGELQERFDALMTRAVRRCLTGRDVLSLSGGIDSPTVAGYGAPAHEELFGRPLPALSIVCPGHPSVDETEYIRTVVERFGLPWHTYEQRVRTGGDLGRWVALCDGPIPTVTMNEIEECYSTVRQLGFRNMLTGEMAEFVVDRADGLLVHLLVRGRARALVRQVRRQRANRRTGFAIARELASVFAPRWLIVRRQRQSRRKWASPPWVDEKRIAPTWARLAHPPRTRWRTKQLQVLQGPGLTVEASEVCEMVCGVRVRRPWVDVDLWNFFLSLPAEVKYEGPLPKSIIRRLARGRVPDAILDRDGKAVFDASIRERLDFDELGRWLGDPTDALPGVDYRLLRSRLQERRLNLSEYRWARDLAAAHAFLEHCGG